MNTLPGTVWTIDGYQVEVGADWSCNETANLGFDQFRAKITPRSAHALPWTVGIGSVVKGQTDDGYVIWEGTISAPLQIEADEWVRVAAQGYAYEAAKIADRFPILVTAPESWVVANIQPFDLAQVASAQPTLSYTASESQGAVRLATNNLVLDFTSGQDISIVFWARGSRVSRVAARFVLGADTAGSGIYGAIGPNIASTLRLLVPFSPSNINAAIDVDVPLSSGFDAVIFRYKFSVATTTTRNIRTPTVWCETHENSINAATVARGIGDHLGWDTAGVQDVGDALFPSFDWGGTASGALSEAVGPDDLVWTVRDRRGTKAKLEVFEWGDREWTVSGSTGARWSLERMERYNRVTAQFLDDLGQVRTVTLDADPDPLNGRGTKEALVTLGGLVPVDVTSNTAEVLTQKVLDALSPQRYRGTIETAFAYGDLGRLATYEVRAGDTVRISDFSKLDGALTDRIAAVAMGQGGISITLEPSVLAGDRLSGRGGIAPGTLLPPTNLPSYKPPGAAGTTTPKTSTPFPDDVLEPWINDPGTIYPGPFKPPKF